MSKTYIRSALDCLLAKIAVQSWRRREGLLILTYHRVLPRTYPELDIVEPGMVVHDDTFDTHLGFLKKHFEVVNLVDWLQMKMAGGQTPKLACAITFDDGWRDNYLYAYPLLSKHKVPATIFVVSSLVGTDTQFWPERLARAVRHRSSVGHTMTSPWLDKLLKDSGVGSTLPDREGIAEIIQAAKREADNVIHANLDEVNRLEGVPAVSGRDLINWVELKEMASSRLVTVGSHTRSHVRMAGGMRGTQLEDELLGSKVDIETNIGQSADIFCYPNGDTCPEADAVVRSVYLGACTTTVGWNNLDGDPFLLRRINIHEGRAATLDGFAASLTGWL